MASTKQRTMHLTGNVLVGISILASALLGLEKIGGVPILPGTATGFRIDRILEQKKTGLSLKKDLGDKKCSIWLRLSKKVDPSPIRVTSDNSAGLKAISDNNDAVTIVATKGDRKKFDWPSGISLSVAILDNDVDVIDWRVYLSDGSYDSWSRARNRSIWFGVCCVLFIGSIIYKLIETRLTKPNDNWLCEALIEGRIRPRECVEYLIQKVELKEPADTDKVQQILKDVLLQGMKLEDALELQKISPPFRIWLQARKQFRDRLGRVMKITGRLDTDLKEFRDLLE